VHDREKPLADHKYTQLLEDMTQELTQAIKIRVIKNGQEKLGAEVDSIFVEFETKADAESAATKLRSRIYDGRKVEICFIEECVYADLN